MYLCMLTLCKETVSFPFLPKSFSEEVRVLVTQSCLTLCHPLDCRPPGCSSIHWTFRARTLSGSPLPSPGDLPNPGIEPWSPALQADSLPSEPLGKPQILLYLQPMGYLLSLLFFATKLSIFLVLDSSAFSPHSFPKKKSLFTPFVTFYFTATKYGLFSIHTFITQIGWQRTPLRFLAI